MYVWDTNSATFSLRLKSLIKVLWYVLYDRSSILQTLLIICCLSLWMTWHFFHIVISLTWWWAVRMFKILNRSLATFERWIPLKGVCSAHGLIMKSFLKHFISVRSWLLKFNTTLYWKSWSLKVCHFTGLQQSQNALNTNPLKHQLHKNATFCYSKTTLIHSKSTQQYLAAHRCIISS
jgi:hypothetical protein